MTEFGYKVTLQADQCGVKRFVAFHSPEELIDPGTEARWHVPSQTCPRCGVNHTPDDFFPVDVQMAVH